MKKFLSLFIIAILTLSIHAKELIPGGESAGVVLRYDGVLVTGTYAFFIDEKEVNLNEAEFKSGDLIVSCQQNKISSIDDLIKSIQECVNNNEDIIVDVNHQGQIIQKNLNVYYDKNSQTFKTGLYITDHMSAIGTITYYDPESMTFGAFGHSLDVEDYILNIHACEIFDAYITSIQRNTTVACGKKLGTIEKTKKIGNVKINHHLGIFGTYQQIYKEDLSTYEIDKPKKGEAIIYTTLTDNQTKAYTIEIDAVSYTDDKNISFHITDQFLINQTNGIVPGMSGSPIIQNGKLVGAVTHVMVNDPKKGYGIFIENMLEAAK